MTPSQEVLRRITLEEWKRIRSFHFGHPYGESLIKVTTAVAPRTGLDWERCKRAAHMLYTEVVHGHINPHDSLDDL